MNPSTYLKISFIIVIILACIEAVPKKQLQSPLRNQDLKFDPCRLSLKFSPAVKKRLRKRAVTVLSGCGLNIVPLISEEDWGSAAKLLAFIPRFRWLLCLTLREVYACFADDNGRIPAKLAANATDMYEFEMKLIILALSDTSMYRDMCVNAPSKNDSSTVTYCYEKRQVLRLTKHILPCLGGALKGTLPEHVDSAIYAATHMLAICETNGFVNYLVQSGV